MILTGDFLKLSAVKAVSTPYDITPTLFDKPISPSFMLLSIQAGDELEPGGCTYLFGFQYLFPH